MLLVERRFANSVPNMTEPTPPDGHQPAKPPRFPEQIAPKDFTGEPDDLDTARDASGTARREGELSDVTPPRALRPDVAPPSPESFAPAAPPTAAYIPVSPQAAPSGPPPGQYSPASSGQYPPANPSQFPPQAPGQYPPTPYQSAPGGPGYGGPPPAYVGAGGPGAPGNGPKKKNGLLVAGLVALVVALVGALAFVVTQIGGDDTAEDPPTTEEEEEEPEDTEPEDTEPDDTVASSTTSEPLASGTVDGLFVKVEPSAVLIADADIQSTLQRIGAQTDDNPVSTTDDVLNLCAAVPVTGRVAPPGIAGRRQLHQQQRFAACGWLLRSFIHRRCRWLDVGGTVHGGRSHADAIVRQQHRSAPLLDRCVSDDGGVLPIV
jgi:hypothetical protein